MDSALISTGALNGTPPSILELLRAVGGDRFPATPMRVLGGGRR